MNPSQKLWFEILDKQIKQLKRLNGQPLSTEGRRPDTKTPGWPAMYHSRRPINVVEAECPLPGTEIPLPAGTQTPQATNLAVGIVFNNLVTHLKLGWSLFQDASKPSSPPLTDPFVLPLRVDTPPSPAEVLANVKRRAEEAAEIERIVATRDDDEHRPWWSRKTKYVEFANHACILIRKIGKRHNLKILPVQDLQDHFRAFLKITSIKDTKSRQRVFVGLNAEETFTTAVADLLKVDLKKEEKNHWFTLSHLLANLETKLIEAE